MARAQKMVEVKKSEAPNLLALIHRVKGGDQPILVPESDARFIAPAERFLSELTAEQRESMTDLSARVPLMDVEGYLDALIFLD